MKSESNSTMLMEMADAVLKSWWTIVVGAALGLAGGLAALQFIPKQYQAQSLVRVVPQQIPEEMVPSTITEDLSLRLGEIREAVLVRSNMEVVVREHFGWSTDSREQEGMIRWVRSNIDVVHRPGTLLFALGYEDSDAERAAGVVNTLTELYVERNRDYRATQAEKTRAEFEERAEKAQLELDQIKKEITAYRRDHPHETGEFLEANIQRLANRRRDLDSNRTNQIFARQRVSDLGGRLEGKGAVILDPDTDEPSVADPLSERISRARSELAQLRVDKLETHPDVLAKQRELADLLAAAASRPTSEGGGTLNVDPATAALRTQLAAAKTELERLRIGEGRLKQEIDELEKKIDVTPEVQSRLTELEGRARVLNDRYQDLKQKAERARSSEYLEASDQGQRLEVIERAVVPFRPVSPDPVRVRLIGVLVGVLLFVGPVLLGRVLNPIITSEAGILLAIDVPVLVSIPRIVTTENEGYGRRRFLKNLGLSLLAAAVLAAAFAVFGW